MPFSQTFKIFNFFIEESERGHRDEVPITNRQFLDVGATGDRFSSHVSCMCAPASINFGFWWGIHTHTLSDPEEPAGIHQGGLNAANFYKPI